MSRRFCITLLAILSLAVCRCALASSVFRDNQGCTMSAGVAGQTHQVDFYDSVTGQQVTVTSFSLGATHADLVGHITASIVSGHAVITVDASGITGSTTPRWWTGTINGVTIATGANIFIVSRVTDTITAPCTLAQDYPTSSSVTDIAIVGTGQVTGAGHVIDFSTNTLYGGITVASGIKISNMGDSTHSVINVPVGHCAGDAHIILNDGVEFDNCGQVFHYENCTGAGGYVVVGKIKVDANSQVTMDASLGGSTNQFYQRLDGNSVNPSTYDSGLVCLKSWLDLDSVSNARFGGVFAGLRCGVHLDGTCTWVTKTDLYCHCTQTLLTWADVANFEFNANVAPGGAGKVILLGGEWIGHNLGDGSTVDGWIFGQCTSHYYLGPSGGSTGTTIQHCLFLPGDESVGVANAAGRVKIGGANVTVQHNSFLGKSGDTYYAPAISINDGVVATKVSDNLFYKLQLNRGPGSAGDPAIGPLDGSEGFEDITGSPLRPASNPNRMGAATNNAFVSCVSVGGDTYTNYGVGTSTGTPGTNDVSTDPTFAGGSGAFDFTGWETNLISGSATIAQLYNAIEAFYTPNASSYANNASDSTTIGAITYSAPAAAGSAHMGSGQLSIGGNAPSIRTGKARLSQ